MGLEGLEPPTEQGSTNDLNTMDLGQPGRQAANAPAAESDALSASEAADTVESKSPVHDDLRHLIDAWPTLPRPIRAGILAMVEAAGKDSTE